MINLLTYFFLLIYLFSLYSFHFYSSQCHALTSLVSLNHNPSWSSVKNITEYFGMPVPFRLEGCLSLGIGTWAPSLSIFDRILSLVCRSTFLHKVLKHTKSTILTSFSRIVTTRAHPHEQDIHKEKCKKGPRSCSGLFHEQKYSHTQKALYSPPT